MKKFNFISGIKKAFHVFGLLAVLFSIFIVLPALLLQYAGRANAQISSFYPTSCLGGWQNADKVVGPPDAFTEDESNFSDENSASVFNSVAEIFCGGFEGEIPEDALHKKVILNFSWTAEKTVDDTDDEILDETVTEEEETEIQDTATENISNTEEIIIEPEPADKTPQENEPTPEPVVEPEPEAEILPETSTIEEPVSFFENLFYLRAYAEETEDQSITEDQDPTEEENITDPESDAVDEKPLIEELDTPSSNIIEVRYTLDGTEWKSLGYVSEINDDVSFEMPMEEFTTIADLERVQISLRTLSTFDIIPKIYLDAMWLEVLYDEALPETNQENEDDSIPLEENNSSEEADSLGEELMKEIIGQVIGAEDEEIPEEVVEEQEEELVEETLEEPLVPELQEQITEEVPIFQPLSIRKFEKKIIIDKEAVHSCAVKPFKVDISGVDTYIVPVILEKAVQGLYELEIGSLPNGVDITFTKNNQYAYQPETSESEVDLKIINETGSQKGDFNILIIYSKKNMHDSSVICQINIINQ